MRRHLTNISTTRLTVGALILLVFFMMTAPAEAQSRSEEKAVANPTFFEARSDAQRCAAIQVWISSIIEEGGRAYGDLNQVQVQHIRRLAVPGFRHVFGKTFAEMSKDERKQVAGALKKCSKELWVEYALAHPFKLPDGGDAKGWVKMFEQYDRSGIAEMRARVKRADAYVSNETPEAELKRRVYFVGDLLLETGLYKLYANNYTSDFDRRYGDGKGWKWCHPDKRAALVTLIFKGDDHYEVKNDEAYWARFEREVAPAVLARCPEADTVYADHQVEGFYIYYGRWVGMEAKAGESVEPLSRASYQISARKRSWTLFVPGGSWGVKADETVTSIAAVKKVLEAVNEAQRVGTREWEAEKARKAEQQRAEALARRRARDRAMSAEVLKVLELAKGKAPERYDFTGYEQREALRNIYEGNFKPLTGGYEYADQFKVALSLDLGSMIDMTRHGAPNSIAYYAYHQEYAKQCRSNREIPWEKLVIKRELVSVEVRGYFEIERNRWPLESYEFMVRRPYLGAFSQLYMAGKQNPLDQAIIGISPTLLGEYGRDFEKFLKKEGCGSPAVRHFEVNLHLVTGWMLPLQELR